ncbi:MAG: hypothetical protein KDD94_00450 [Calditrichaeota bacterium]|nr:hypothetical protein [Calditrichota bacterium]
MSKPDWNAFIGYLLHDLKSPLAVISAYSSMIKMDDPDQKHTEKIDTIQTYIRSIDKLLSKFQEFNRVNQSKLKRSDFLLQDEFAKVKSQNQKLFIHNPDFELPKSVSNLKLHADHELINKLLKNLIEFSVELYNSEVLKCKFSLSKTDSKVMLIYSDNNLPIENDDIAQLYHSDISIKKPNLLDAFRLAIINDIITRHKWQVDFKAGKNGHHFAITIDKKDLL